jgi:trehalose 6-phosphate phosphatase
MPLGRTSWEIADTVSLVVADPAGTLLALDFDGTLAHVVDDPTEAYAHERSVAALARLGRVIGQVAIVTGRPVAQALELGGFEGTPGFENLVICGQYGAVRGDARAGRTVAPERSAVIDDVVQLLPAWLAEHGLPDARLEDKGLAVAVHTRGLPGGALDAILEPLGRLADEHGLTLEPGRQVLELRAAAVDKGDVVRDLVAETGATTVLFAGDDLGDLPAYDAVDALRLEGVTGLLVCSASEEQDALARRADLVLQGPDAIARWLEALADAV